MGHVSMADPDHFQILKQGPDAWNLWRRENSNVTPDLSWAYLCGMNLRGINLRRANLEQANLCGADLGRGLHHTMIIEQMMLFGEDWEEASYLALGSTDLRNANLKYAKLDDTFLTGAIMTGVDLTGATLQNVRLDAVAFGITVFCDVDLRRATLTDLQFFSPCFLDILTLRKLAGCLEQPERQVEIHAFLQGCGLKDWEIEAIRLHNTNLSSIKLNDILTRIHGLRCSQTALTNPLFISYNHDDGPFVEALEKCLAEAGIRFWRDVHHATAGRLEEQIERAMRVNPIVVLVLSERSLRSDWVQHEARMARDLELKSNRKVLCPIALDGTWKTSHWPARLIEQIKEYNILDFSDWKNPALLAQAFAKLRDGLSLYYADGV
jgi:uncharacterized protein YjbI with pentapeptide repeats